jgi:hypothetical protein
LLQLLKPASVNAETALQQLVELCAGAALHACCTVQSDSVYLGGCVTCLHAESFDLVAVASFTSLRLQLGNICNWCLCCLQALGLSTAQQHVAPLYQHMFAPGAM